MPPSVFCVANIVKFVALVKILDCFFKMLPLICTVGFMGNSSICQDIHNRQASAKKACLLCVMVVLML